MFIILLFKQILKIYYYRDFNLQISFPNLKYLILDNNMITSINNFPSIPSLQTLSLSNNGINDLSSFINGVRAKFPNIRSLNTFKNPMNPGMMNPGNYNQYKMYMKQIGNIAELDGMNINDNSFMNQGQQGSQPKRDLFGTSGNANTMVSSQPHKVDFFGNNQTNTQTFNQPAQNMNMTQAAPHKPKMGMFDNMPTPAQKPMNQNTMMYANNAKQINYSTNTNNGKVFQRQYYIIDESEELDGTEFVQSKKKKSLIMFNEKIFKKSDNMTNFNRKNRSEGNKHILNQDL